MTDLFNSIFTPGPTPSLLVATNVSFGALQLLLLALLVATHSVHFVALSVLCAGLWLSINWFVHELQATNTKEEEIEQLRPTKASGAAAKRDESATKIERTGIKIQSTASGSQNPRRLSSEDSTDALRERRSFGDISIDRSTDSEWEKVSEHSTGQE